MSNLEERACKILEDSCLKAFEEGKKSRCAEIERLKTLNEMLTETNAEIAGLALKMRNQVNELQSEIIGMQKTIIAQGQKFNDQTQRIKDLEFELGKPNLVYMRLRDYINRLEGSLKVATNSLDREMVKTLLKNLDYLCHGEKSK